MEEVDFTRLIDFFDKKKVLLQADLQDLRTLILLTADTALVAADSIFVDYKLEGQDLQQLNYGTSDGLEMTASFWIKSNKTGTYVFWLYQYDDSRQVQVQYTINSPNTWEYKTLLIPQDNIGVIDNDNGAGLVLRFIMGSGSNYTSGTAPVAWQGLVDANRYVGQTVNLADSTSNYMNLTGFQLELGKVATPFEHRSYGEELALCQRYYYKRNATVNGDRFCLGNASSTTDFRGFIEFPVEMRANPTFETSGTASHFSIVTGTNGVVTCNDIPTAGLQKWGGLINAETASGLTAGHGGQLRAASTSAYIAASAEL